jgi:hypothetical protein
LQKKTFVDKIFSTKISEHQGHLFEVGLLLSHDGIKRRWRVEVRLLDTNGHPMENGAIVLDEQFAEVAIADEAGVRAANRLVEERLSVPNNQWTSPKCASTFS